MPAHVAVRRGEVWWVQLEPTRGSEIGKMRPCVVLSSDILNTRRRTVVVVPLSSSPQARPPLLVPIDCAQQRAVAVTDQVRAIAKERIRERLDILSAEDLRAVEDGVREILEL